MAKTSFIILAAGLLSCAFTYARHAEWDKSAKPPVSLQQALEIAETELKNDGIEYFCIGASLANTFSGGDWELHFSSKEGKEMWISVGSDRKPRKSATAFQH